MSAKEVKALRQQIIDHPVKAADLLVKLFAMLGSEFEWSMEHNFETTEAIARLATDYGMPSVGDQSDEDQQFWERVAAEVG